MMQEALSDRINEVLEERSSKGLERSIPNPHSSEDYVNLADNDYLGLARHPQVIDAAVNAFKIFGSSASASPLVSGYKSAHQSLLDKVLNWHRFDYGMIWNSGYAANQAILSQLAGAGDLILADRLIHNSMISGSMRSGARLVRYRHCDLDHLEALLVANAKNDRIIFVVTESVFSMDGDFPDLKRLAALKSKFGFFWIVDEAHALGWYGSSGCGLAEEFGVAAEVDILVGTLGKALGSMGAYTLFHDDRLKRFLANFAGEFIYSTYLAPSSAAAAEAAISCIQKDDSLRSKGREIARRFRGELSTMGLEVTDIDSPIVSVIFGDAARTMEIAESLRRDGFLVGGIRPPTVPQGSSRLRISLKANLDSETIDRFLASLKKAIDLS